MARHQSGHNRSAKDRVALWLAIVASHLLEVAMEENHASVIDGEQKQTMEPPAELVRLKSA